MSIEKMLRDRLSETPTLQQGMQTSILIPVTITVAELEELRPQCSPEWQKWIDLVVRNNPNKTKLLVTDKAVLQALLEKKSVRHVHTPQGCRMEVCGGSAPPAPPSPPKEK